MASTYSDLKIELIGTGEQVGTWGSTTNTNLGTAIEEAITGSADVSFSSADVTLTLTNTNGTQTARNLRLVCTGTSGGARNLILGSGCQIEKLYLIQNDLADTVTVKNTTGTGVAVPSGGKKFVFNDGTNVVEATSSTVNLATDVTGTLPVANGGTGSTSTTYCSLTANVTGTLPVVNGGTGRATLTSNNVLLGNGTSQVDFVAPGASGNVLTSNGSTWTSGAAFVTGMIMLWSGSTASIPSGWALCNGSSGTPDLRNRFIVGAGSTYAVNATGGSADAIVVSHNHSASSSSSVSDPGHVHPPLNPGDAFTSGNGSDVGNGPSTQFKYNTTTGSAVTGISVSTSTTVNTAGSSGTNANLPPYYALAYIMKL
jgi:hypothetical protein